MTKTAFLFSGQGSQTIGMGLDLYRQFPAARLVFEEVDDVLHEKLSELMFQGDIQKLTQTQNAQPAIMTVGMAVVRALEQELGHPLSEMATYMAGHSLGEYTALCAAGALTLSDAAKLLHFRGWAMMWASSIIYGGMSAVLGLHYQSVVEAIRRSSTPEEQLYVANDNCPGQIIVSGHLKALERLNSIAVELGAKRVLPLSVVGAFHSPYMKPAADEMFHLIQNSAISSPKVPVISNITASPETSPDHIKKNLYAQITGPVRWTESAELMIRQGVDTFVECGSGKVITGLMKRITPTASLYSLSDSDSIHQFTSAFESKTSR